MTFSPFPVERLAFFRRFYQSYGFDLVGHPVCRSIPFSAYAPEMWANVHNRLSRFFCSRDALRGLPNSQLLPKELLRSSFSLSRHTAAPFPGREPEPQAGVQVRLTGNPFGGDLVFTFTQGDVSTIKVTIGADGGSILWEGTVFDEPDPATDPLGAAVIDLVIGGHPIDGRLWSDYRVRYGCPDLGVVFSVTPTDIPSRWRFASSREGVPAFTFDGSVIRPEDGAPALDDVALGLEGERAGRLSPWRHYAPRSGDEPL